MDVEVLQMKTFMINLNSIEKVKSFVTTIGEFDGYFDLVAGRYIVDAKSIMGIFSMDLSKNVELRILETHNDINEIEKALEAFIVK